MSWTSPATAVTGNVITAAFWNINGRDNLNLTMPALCINAGDIIYATGANTPVQLTGQTKFQHLRTNLATTAPEFAFKGSGAGVYSTNSQSIITTTAALTFDSVDFDFDSMSNLGVNNDRLTFTRAGIYHVIGTVVYTLTAGHGYLFLNRYNSSNTLQDTYGQTAMYNINPHGLCVNAIMNCSAGDYVRAMFFTPNNSSTIGGDATNRDCSLIAIPIR